MESYTRADFLDTDKPYKYLYALRNTPLQHEQTLCALKENARAVGVRNFEKLYEAFLASQE